MNKTIIFFIMIITLLISACNDGTYNSEDLGNGNVLTEMAVDKILEKIVLANSGLESYKVNVKMDSNMQGTVEAKPVNMITYTDSEGLIDRKNNQLYLKTTVSADMSGQKMDIESEIYIIESKIYSQTMGMWMKMDLEQDLWNEQDQMEQVINLVKTGTLEKMADEKIGSESYYVVKVTPDLQAMLDLSMGEEDRAQLMDEDINLEELLEGYTYKVWVNKDTYIIEKSEMEMDMVMTPESAGLDEGSEMTIKMKMEVMVSGINEPVSIKLPDAAKTAQDINMIGATDEDISMNIPNI